MYVEYRNDICQWAAASTQCFVHTLMIVPEGLWEIMGWGKLKRPCSWWAFTRSFITHWALLKHFPSTVNHSIALWRLNTAYALIDSHEQRTLIKKLSIMTVCYCQCSWIYSAESLGQVIRVKGQDPVFECLTRCRGCTRCLSDSRFVCMKPLPSCTFINVHTLSRCNYLSK